MIRTTINYLIHNSLSNQLMVRKGQFKKPSVTQSILALQSNTNHSV